MTARATKRQLRKLWVHALASGFHQIDDMIRAGATALVCWFSTGHRTLTKTGKTSHVERSAQPLEQQSLESKRSIALSL